MSREPWPTSQTSAPTRSASVVWPCAPASARNQPTTATAIVSPGSTATAAGARGRSDGQRAASGAWPETVRRPSRASSAGSRGADVGGTVGGSADQSSPTHLDPDAAPRPARHAGSLGPVMPTPPTPPPSTSTTSTSPAVAGSSSRPTPSPATSPRPGSAVRDAFVAARHHWRKVGRLARPRGVGAPPRLGDGPAPARRAALAPREGAHRRAEALCSPPCTTCPTSSARCCCSPSSPALSTRRRSAASSARRPSRVEERARPRDPRRSADATGSAPRRASSTSLESLAPLAEATALPPPDAIHRGGRRRRAAARRRRHRGRCSC